MTAMRLHRYPSPSGGIALGKMGVGATMLKQGKTARDYVQSGLVAMWDGIENAGWGVHDANATTWKDLVSGTLNDVSGKGEFTANAFHATTRMVGNLDTTAIRNAIGMSVFSAEAVFSSASINAAIFMWGDPRAFAFTTLADYATRFLSGNTVISQTDSDVGKFTEGYSIARNGLQAKAYFRGVQLGAETTCAAIGNPTAGIDVPAARTINNFRIYSRALTADEIAANYAIDKERFNLP